MDDGTELPRELTAMVEGISKLHGKALAAYSPVVESLLKTSEFDAQQIEHTLDGLLDFCGNDSILELYPRLGRHYYTLDPAAAISYVNAYREMYETDIDLETERGQ